MRMMARLTLASLGLALATPLSAMAGDAPVSRSAAANTTVSVHKHKHGLLGKQNCAQCAAKAAHRAAEAAPAAVETSDARHCPHMANGVCLECTSKLAIVAPEEPVKARAAVHRHEKGEMAAINRTAVPASLVGGSVVSCAHMKNGVCGECKSLLEMPGQVSVVSQAAPGRAKVSDIAAGSAPGRAMVQAGEPEPIGVMRTNYNVSQNAAGVVAPGRAVVSRGPASAPAVPSAPYMPATTEGSPHIMGHLFGISEMRNDFRDWRASKTRQKKEAHAAIPYGPNAGAVDELPASMVYGKSAH